MHSIKFKISLAFGICLLIMAIVGGAGIAGIARLNSNLHTAYYGNTVPISQLMGLSASEFDIRRQLRRIQVIRDVKAAEKIFAEVKAVQAEMDRQWQGYYPSGISSPEEKVIAEQIAASYPVYRASVDKAVAALLTGNFDAAAAVVDDTVPIAQNFHDALSKDVGYNVNQSQQFIADSLHTYHLFLWGSISAISLGILIIICAMMYLFKAISTPLNSAIGLMGRIAEGELTAEVVVSSRDEFARLLAALNKMKANLVGIVSGVKASSEAISVAASEIAVDNADLSERTQLQTVSIKETTNNMNTLTETVRQNADSARKATSLASTASDVADKSNAAVKRMLSTMHDISSSSSKIADITNLIEAIAFQTNILALNAAVEAARAGEQGRGFTVVASEVRNLAQRSSAAAKEIKELIEISVSTIRNGASQAEEVGLTMLDVQKSIRQVSDINAEIAAASEV